MQIAEKSPPGSSRPTALVVGWASVTALAKLAALAEVSCVVTPDDVGEALDSGFVTQVVCVTDSAALDQILEALARLGIDLAGFDVVCGPGESEMIAVSVLGALGGQRVLPIEVAVALRDKFVQKQRVRAAGLPTAECQLLDGRDAAPEVRLGLPGVVKPCAGAGAADTWRMDTVPELHAFLDREFDAGPWLLESFQSGAEHHVDGVISGGRITSFAVSRYLDNVIHIHEGAAAGSVMMRATHDPDLHERARELVERSLQVLGQRDGVFHLEFFDQRDSAGVLAFGECAGRLGGGKIAETYTQHVGVDLEQEWAWAQLGLPGTPAPAAPGGAHGWVQLATEPGTLRVVPSADQVRERPGVTFAEVNARAGQRARNSTVASHIRSGRVVVEGPDEASVEARLREIVSWFCESTEVEQAGAMA